MRKLGRVTIAAVCAWGLAIAAVGLVGSLWAAAALLALAGAVDSVSAVCRSVINQTVTPDALRGRMSSVFSLVVTSGPRLGDVEAGTVASLTSPRVSVVSGGVACVVCAGIVVAAFPALARYDKEEALAAGSYDPPVSDLLSVRALNRATLARQLLLKRADMTALDAVEHLVGMQAQIPHDPYLGLWSRLASFDPAALGRLLVERKVVRIVVMRGTIHLVSADDCLALRPLMQPVLDAELRRHPQSGPALEGVDVEPVLAYVRTLVAQAPRTGAQLRAAIAQRFPQHDAAALAYACRNLLAFVQVPPRGVWGQTMQVSSTTAEHWLGRPLAAAPSIDEVVVRYIAAFGPATVADIASWSRLTGMRAVVERIAPRLRVFRDERGRALYDLPDAPRPAADTPAPVRFLPEYDNVLLSHADRGRFYCAKQRGRLSAAPPRPIKGTVLVEGVVRATWRIDRGDDGAMLLVDHAGAFARHDAQAVETEGAGMLRFLEPERAAAGGEVRLVRVDG